MTAPDDLKAQAHCVNCGHQWLHNSMLCYRCWQAYVAGEDGETAYRVRGQQAYREKRS